LQNWIFFKFKWITTTKDRLRRRRLTFLFWIESFLS
jgi:hypothetical protein